MYFWIDVHHFTLGDMCFDRTYKGHIHCDMVLYKLMECINE